MSAGAPGTSMGEVQVNPATRYGVLVGAIIVQLILGTVYGYSIFWQPLEAEIFPQVITEAQRVQMQAAGQEIAGYQVVADEAAKVNATAVHQGYLKYAFSICILSFAVVMVIAGRVQDVTGPRFPAIVGAMLMGGGFLVAGLMNNSIVFHLAHSVFTGTVGIVVLMIYHAIIGKLDQEEMPILRYAPLGIIAAVITAGVLLGNDYVGKLGEMDKLFLLWGTVGFLAGAGIGFAYVCPIAALVKWFPKQKGLVAGVAVAGFGLGAFVFSRPELPFSAENFIKTYGVTQLFVVHGLVCIVAVTLGAMLLRNPPGTPPKTAVAESAWQDTLRRPAFYMLWLMFFSGALAGLMVIGVVKPFVQDQLKQTMDLQTAAATGAAAVGMLSIFNALGRIVWGFVSDKIGRTPAFVAMFLIQALVMFVLGTLDTKMALYVGAGVVGFNFGGNFALFPSATADLFGAKNLGANYGWVFTSYGIAGVVGIVAGNTAKTMTQSYQGAFVLAAILCLISAALAVGLKIASARKSAA